MWNRTFWFAFLLLCAFGTTTRAGGQQEVQEGEPEPFHFKCDDLVSEEHQCSLQEEIGTIEIRGLTLQYYLYTPENYKHGAHSKLPLVMVNGGPGAAHGYMITLKYMACDDRQVLFYDQVGTGESSSPENIPEDAPWLHTIPYYVEELKVLTESLGFHVFDLLGHSWGGCLALEFVLEYPGSVEGLILASTLSDAQLYITAQQEYLHTTLPPIMQRLIKETDETKEYDSPAYAAMSDGLTSFWTCRTLPMPDCVVDAFSGLNYDIYIPMQGASEFTISGVLGEWSVHDQIHKIDTPTLVTAGKYDTMAPPVNEAIANEISGSRLVVFPHAGHLTMIDDADLYLAELKEFLNNVHHQRVAGKDDL